MVLLTVELSEAAMAQLAREAERMGHPVDVVARDLLEGQLVPADTVEEVEDTPDEYILQGLRISLRQALTGQTIPADEALAAIRKRLADDNAR